MEAVFLVTLLGLPPLTMDAAVEQALQAAPELAARQNRELAAEAKVDEASSSYWPRASLEAVYMGKTPKNELPIDLPPTLAAGLDIGDIDDIHHFRGGLDIKYRLLDFSRGALVDAAKAQLEAETHESESTRAQLAFAVRATFLAALLSRDVEQIASESLEVAQEEERRAELKAEVGTGTQVGLSQARVRVASLHAQERRAKSELSRHLAKLQSLVGLDTEPDLDGELEALVGPVQSLDLASSPELLGLAAKKRAAESAAEAQDNKLIPTLSAQASAEMVYPRALALEIGPVLQVSLLFSWQFFDGFQSSSAAKGHEAMAAALDALSDATRRRIERELIDLEARARTARADLESTDKTLAETAVYLRVAKAAVEAGTGTELDVHTAELGIDQAKTARQRALFELAMVRAQTLRVYGTVLGKGQG